MSSLYIREATEADIDTIRAIALKTWPVAYGHILSQAQMDYMLDMMYSEPSLQHQMNQGIQFFLAEQDGLPIAFAAVGQEPMEGLFKLHKLYVRPDVQRSGAGKALLDAVITYAREHAGEQLTLQVNRHNAAVDFYKKQGFSIHYEADFDIGQGYHMNDYVMGRAL